MIRRAPRAKLAHFLERERRCSPVERALGALWARAADPVRPVVLPARTRVIGVGGATLGGSYKTPLAAALARRLRELGQSVSVVAHGYRARPGTPRPVGSGDAVRDVGDDALLLARELEEIGVPVVVGRRRSEALALAASMSRVVIVDGLLQASPVRLDWSLLVVDAEQPWGSGRCPPAGDLRARPEALLAAADALCVVADARTLRDGPNPSSPRPFPSYSSVEHGRTFRAVSDVSVARSPGPGVLSLGSLASIRVGFVSAIARPERVLLALRGRAIEPVEIRLFGDHGVPAARGGRRVPAVDVWLTTKKCATKLGAFYDGAPLAVLDHRLTLPSDLVEAALGGIARAAARFDVRSAVP